MLQFTSFQSLLLKPKTFSSFSPNLKLHPKLSIQNTQVSLQEQSQTSTVSSPPHVKTTKSNVWVNPNSSRATQLRKNSYDFRYSSLIKIAEYLDNCNPIEEDVSKILITLADNNHKIVEHDAVVVLNNMSNPNSAPFVLKWFQERVTLSKEVILYNVTMKVFRKGKALDKAEKLFDEMLQRDVKPDNVTFSTLISCARYCNLPEKAVEWFEKMSEYECDPDDVTYCVMIDAYGRAGKVDKALSLYDRARAEKWRVDAVTFATIIRIYGGSGNFDGCLNVYQEMKAIGIKPNVLVFNNLLDAMGRAKRPWQAKNLYKEMITSGLNPNWATYAALIRGFGRARYGEDAIKIYREMKEKKMQLNIVLYNTLLAMCADLGLVDEALEIFEDIKRSITIKPDSWTYSSLITVYSCSGKLSEVEKFFNEMLESGFEPNIFIFTSLIQAYGKANAIDHVITTFNRLIELDITPDERFCGCLLNVMTHVNKEELLKLTECIEMANPKVGLVVNLIVNGGKDLRKEAEELFREIGDDVKKAYCNCLIDLCVNLNELEKACELLDIGLSVEIYTDLQSKSVTQWSLHLKSLSLGAALTALHIWMNDLSRAIEEGEELPALLGINTGHGKHKYSEKGLAGVFESHLKELNAPFHEANDQLGWFLTTKVAATTWLESRRYLEGGEA